MIIVTVTRLIIISVPIIYNKKFQKANIKREMNKRYKSSEINLEIEQSQINIECQINLKYQININIK